MADRQKESRMTAAVETSAQKHNNNNNNNSFDLNDDDDDDEQEIQEWMLRFRFEEYQFSGPVWEGLQAAGWTYAPVGGYRSPNNNNGEQNFKDGKAICKYLDKFCIVPLYNTLQLPPDNPLLDMSSEEIQQGEELRRNVIRHVYKKMSAVNKRRNKHVNNEGEAADKQDTTTTSRRRHTSRLRKQSHATTTSSSNKSTEETTTTTTTTTVAKRPSRPRRRPAKQIANKTTATAFEKGADTFLRKSRPTKSNNTVSYQDIAFLKFPNVTECIEQFRHDNESMMMNHSNEIFSTKTQDFDDWKFLLTTQNSLLLYGYGSKRKLLDSFAREKLEEQGDVLTMDGFDCKVRMESILDVLVDHFLNGTEPEKERHLYQVDITDSFMIGTHEIVQRAARIARALAVQQELRQRPIYLVLHNIDGPCLCSRDVQQALAALVSYSVIRDTNVRAVRLAASIDHINASALLWDNTTSANFSWVYKEIHTYRPYIEELAVGTVSDDKRQGKSKKRKANDMQNDATLWNVLASLAPRHAEVVKILATLQSEDLKPVDHAALLRNCKHKMTVTNDGTLRNYLTELKDHGIVESGKDPSTGKEWLRIPHSREKLLEIRDFEME